MAITSVGINSGVLTSDLIDKIVNAERAPTEARLEQKKEDYEAKLSAYGQIRSAMSDLRIEARVLGTPTLFNKLSVSSTNSAISGSATNSAVAGSYTAEVTQLAQAHSIATSALSEFSALTDTIGTGTLTITSGSTSAAITIDSSNSSLQGVVDAINAQSSLNVSAAAVYTGTGYRLVLSATETGLANAVKVEVSGDGDGNSTNNAGLSQLLYDGVNDYLTQTTAALDSNFKINGVSITRASNAVSDVISGLTFNFSSTNSGSPAVITVAQDSDTMASDVSDFIDKFNELQALYNDLTEYNSDTKEAGVLLGDAALRSMFSQVRNNVHQLVAGLAGQQVSSLADAGISTNSKTGEITFNETTFKSALSSYPDDVVGLFSVQGRTSDAQIDFSSYLSTSKADTYNISITRLATQGALTGAAITPPVTIDANNDTFTLKVDSTSSGTITLTQAAYASGAALATEIETQINADTALLAAGKSVSVSFTASNEILITSNSYGSTSKVEVTAVDTNTAADIGLSVASGNTGLDVAGIINDPTSSSVITQGSIASAAVIADPNNIVIDTDNQDLTLSVDGVTSGVVQLATGTYTGATLAAEIQSKINAVSAYQTAGIGVAVAYDATSNKLSITSNAYGTSSKVNITAVDTDTAAEIGFSVADGTDGTGTAATGKGQYLTGASGTDSVGIKIQVKGGSTGSRGTVTLIRGIGDNIVERINAFFSTSGSLTAREAGIQTSLDGIDEEQADLDTRLEKLQQRLALQFTAADILVGQLNNTADFLTSFFKSLTPDSGS